jgi:hypothetical protein
MKKYPFLLFLLLITYTVKGQNNIYCQMFDSLKNSAATIYMTPEANDQSYYGDGMSYFLEALLRMYEQTNNITYIEDFINYSHEIIQNRDDNRGNNRNKPVWSTKSRVNNCYGPITHQTALLLIPLIHYCYLTEFSKNEIFNSLQFSEEFITFDQKIVRNLKEYSYWLNIKLMETVIYYDTNYWDADSCMIQYADDSCETRVNIEGTDRQMNWAYVYLYLALKNQGTERGIYYLNKYEQIVCMYRTILKEKKLYNKIPYYLWPESGWSPYQSGKNEDISHAGATIDLVQFSYDNKDFIQRYSQNNCDQPTYFTETDLWKFANTFTYNIYDSPLKYHNSIDGSCYFWKYPKNCEDYDYSIPYGVNRWVSLSKNGIHPKLTDADVYYYAVTDYYTSYLFAPEKFYTGSMGANLLGIANTEKYIKQMKPIGMIPIDSIFLKFPPIPPVHGSLENLNDGEFSVLFHKEPIFSKEIKFKVVPNTKIGYHNKININFTNVGYQLIPIPLNEQETKWVETHQPNTKSRFATSTFTAHLENDSTFKLIKTIENTIFIYNIDSSLLYKLELEKGNYLYCAGDFNQDHKDEIIIYNKNNGEFTFYLWNGTSKTLMSFNNCKFPQNQFIEYITTVQVNQIDHLVVYRLSDKTFSIYYIDF